MKTLKRAMFLLLAVLMLVGSMAACGGGQGLADIAKDQIAASNDDGNWDGVSPRYGGHINVRSTARPTGLDPLKQTGAWKYQWTTSVYEPFLTRDPDNNMQPAVCDYRHESYQDESGQWYDELWVWPREGYTFSNHSGRNYGQVDMDDIVASWNRGLTQYANIKKFVKPNVVIAEVEDATEEGEGFNGQVFHIKFKYHEKNLYYFAAYRTWWPVMPKEICEKYATSYIINQMDDAIGTGPYYFSDFKDSTYVTLSKRDDYVAVEQAPDAKGQAATKYGYLDSMTFWYNGTDASAANAVLSGQYDLTEVIPSEYSALAEQNGIVLTKLSSDQRTWIFFNTVGTNNVVSKYPSLRKAVMAAIDYPSFLKFVTDDSQILDGDNFMMTKEYDLTYKFKEADYYGEFNQEVVDKYMAQARAEGYKGEPLQIPHHTGRTDIPTMTAASMDQAGINYELVPNENSVYNAFIGDPSNNWDFYFAWGVTYYTPGTLADSLVKDNFKSDRVLEIREELMPYLRPDSAEYMALWEEWVDIWVEECQLGYLSAIDWWWWHPATLHVNDGGDDPNQHTNSRFFYNTWWEDPGNHSA